jgi:hypothetical protein
MAEEILIHGFPHHMETTGVNKAFRDALKEGGVEAQRRMAERSVEYFSHQFKGRTISANTDSEVIRAWEAWKTTDMEIPWMIFLKKFTKLCRAIEELKR